MTAINDRPNIRIEIQNSVSEAMEIDNEEKQVDSDFEDGEISEKNDVIPEESNPLQMATTNRVWNNSEGGFNTGINIFDKEEQQKLQQRASRFGLKLTEINNFTDEDLQQLHSSLGITTENEKNIRFEAIHMRGTDEMSTEDIFKYFAKYGPACVEWINDESCNVVWNDNVSAARALHFISKEIAGMPVEGPCNPFVKKVSSEENEVGKGRSILLKDREIQLEKEDSDELPTDNYNSIVHVSDINVPVPPGYWRLGTEQSKTKFVLLRFAFKTDRKPLKAERFSEYYKKYGNPNFGGLKGLISESCRKKFKGIFDRNKDIPKSDNENSKNPWGDLAESWYEDEQFCERVYVPRIEDEPDVVPLPGEKSDVLKRLGLKRTHEKEEVVENQENNKTSKIPRMRMYADEEEEKMNRKKQLLILKSSNLNSEDTPPQVQDLRTVIGATSKKSNVQENYDLGTKLKNRMRKKEDARQEAEERSNRDASPVEETKKHRSHKRDLSHRHFSYKNKLHSDRYEKHPSSLSFDQKPKSKVAVVIKRQKRPTVASTVWSRINTKKERLKTASERMGYKKNFSSSSESSSDSKSSSNSSSSENSSSDSSSDEENTSELKPKKPSYEQATLKMLDRPGFKSNVQSNTATGKSKSPLRIEINNDHFKEG